MEQTVLDPRDGRPVNASMADYLVPVNLDIGSLDTFFVDESDPHVNPLGVKGLGKIALIGRTRKQGGRRPARSPSTSRTQSPMRISPP